MAKTVLFLNSGTAWTVPLDWDNVLNSEEAIGGGSGGAVGQNGVANGNPGAGGAYSFEAGTTLTPGATVNIAIGTGGAGATSLNTSGAAGTDTWLASNNTATVITSTGVQVGAKGATGGTTSAAGTGGQASAGIGSVKFSGGNGGHTGGHSGAGGGAAGVGGGGGVGGTDDNSQNGGAGGGGGGGGSAGLTRSGTTGGAGGTNLRAVGSGAGGTNGNSGTAGTAGGGGGGAGAGATTSGGDGGSGTEYDPTHGSGGGGGQGTGHFTATSGRGGDGGSYGGGGGGLQAGAAGMRGGNGFGGLLVITYGIDAVRSDTLNPADDAGVTLSNGNLTAVSTTSGWGSFARGTVSYNYGKYYLEATTAGNGGSVAGNAGIGFATASQASFLGVNAITGFGYYPLNGSMSDFTNSAASAVNGALIGMAVDFNAKLMWVRVSGGNWNNSALANPATGVGGFSFTAGPSLFLFVGMQTSGVTWNVNLGAQNFVGTPPSGYVGLSTLVATAQLPGRNLVLNQKLLSDSVAIADDEDYALSVRRQASARRAAYSGVPPLNVPSLPLPLRRAAIEDAPPLNLNLAMRRHTPILLPAQTQLPFADGSIAIRRNLAAYADDEVDTAHGMLLRRRLAIMSFSAPSVVSGASYCPVVIMA